MRLLLAGLALIGSGCAGTATLKQQLQSTEARFHDHIGFVLYDPVSRKTLLEYNSEKYFTPASNTKIFTFYTALQLLGDSIPGLRYTISNDSLFFRGTGDPSFLYREISGNDRVYEFLAQAPQKLFHCENNFRTEAFGPGWAWDDYPYVYSAERSAFPVYGNLAKVTRRPDYSLTTVPLIFSNHVVIGDSVSGKPEVTRDVGFNQIIFRPGKKPATTNEWELPFHTGADLVAELLSDTLKRLVEELRQPDLIGAAKFPDLNQVLNSVPSDSLYRVMMQDSDNFIAEQLLLLCAEALSDTLKPEIAIRYAQKNYFFDLPDKPVWVDGSGLSRYNLFTPRSIARLWEKIYASMPRERLFALLPAGGRRGTLKNWFQAETPWIYGKTGSLSNNHALSGFLLTNKGKVLIFSFMNANFVVSSREIRSAMQDVLTQIRNKY